MKAKLIKLLKKARNFLPSAVPLGVAEFETWASDIISTYDFPNNDSVRFALATMILHSGPTAALVSKRYFALMVKAGAAKQVASQVFQDIKIKQQAEATAQAAAVANVPHIQN